MTTLRWTLGVAGSLLVACGVCLAAAGAVAYAAYAAERDE